MRDACHRPHAVQKGIMKVIQSSVSQNDTTNLQATARRYLPTVALQQNTVKGNIATTLEDTHLICSTLSAHKWHVSGVLENKAGKNLYSE